MAGRLVESLHEDFRPERYKDEYREAVLDVIKHKAAGKEIGRGRGADRGRLRI